ncbi:MAG: PAS domain S-box protein [Saprospiraceae bacterium]|nr:PAS domain S-box protein [Saprospiraceae bacterium]
MFAGIIHDISDIKQKEKELLYSQNQFKAIFESAVDAIIIINQRGIVQIANPATAKLFGYPIEELEGHNINKLMDSPDRAKHDNYIKRYLDTKEAHIVGKGREVLARHKNGHNFPIMLAVSEIQLEQEIFFVGLIHDLSQQKEIEEAIRTMNEELEDQVSKRTEELSKVVNKLLSTNKQLKIEIAERKKVEEALIGSQKELRSSLEKEKELSELKSRFVSMASHEFRTPLSTILSSASLIGKYTEGVQQERRQKHIDRIKSMVNTLTGVLNDFLSLSKLEEGRIQVIPEQFQFNAFCKAVFEQVWPLLKQEQQLKHEALPTEVEVFHDKQLIRNILFNLISNAIKYSPDGSIIHCRTRMDKDKIHIEIQDQGMGIPEADQKHLFTRFFRASNAINIQGTGLGLNIVRSYVDLLKGEISFNSVEGEGTTFYVQIPTQYQA